MNPIIPTPEQVPVLYVIVVYTVVIFAFWVIPGARVVITPLKLFTIGWHEFCHIVAAVFTGGTVNRVSIDPDNGGITQVHGGNHPVILISGYIGSTIMGGVFMLAGFDILVAKILSFVLGLGLIAPLVLVRNKLTILLIIVYEGILVGFWFIDHGQALRWYCLFVGVMNIFYVVWDVADDKYFRKQNDSDATQFAIMYPVLPAHIWATVWILFEIGILVSFVLLGIVAFKRTNAQMYAEAGESPNSTRVVLSHSLMGSSTAHFLPT
ncbi:uncharacterized protein LAESUDRAFT_694683 [Laetiporus sulphureus 93-53]|uniref:Peptidase M50B-like-domain-containing protein n=1 Tax=Laetiporus sulphureus 93-53 TaxID=1314785 RepID=A0A165GAK6_9APHY|nr:uncharacterized protein LAESUDRAFT_694683 [Laetiporus sulphureus 93-53]KZT10074.1 hypothetical protein LAESUDRAFT_694683 [Laetiporus sulphureus 93-53]